MYRDSDSPLLTNRLRATQHNQLVVPSPGSQASTPAELEVEEVVSHLSDQVRERGEGGEGR